MLSIALILLSGVPVSSIDDAKATVTGQLQAWNTGDLKAFTSVYADDAIFVSPSGVTRGRQAVLERYQKRYPDKKAMGTLSFEVVEAREQKDAVSIVAKWTLSYPDKPAQKGNCMIRLLAVFRNSHHLLYRY